MNKNYYLILITFCILTIDGMNTTYNRKNSDHHIINIKELQKKMSQIKQKTNPFTKSICLLHLRNNMHSEKIKPLHVRRKILSNQIRLLNINNNTNSSLINYLFYISSIPFIILSKNNIISCLKSCKIL
jgi:hypothetical protein